MTLREEWLWGWDPTPGIVSVWADQHGRASVWRRDPTSGELQLERVRFRPWVLLDSMELLTAGRSARMSPFWTVRELEGEGELRYLVSAADGRGLRDAVLAGAGNLYGRSYSNVRDIGETHVLSLPPEEQYLVASGRTYFRDLRFDQLRRLQLDLETTGLDPAVDRIFLIAVRDPDGRAFCLEAERDDEAGEAALLQRLVDVVRDADPDVIENHNLFGFDLPFLDARARRYGVHMTLGRTGRGLVRRAASRGMASESDPSRRVRLLAPGRECIDTMDAVLRHDFSARDLPGHGLKAVARHFGLAGPDRVLIRGDRIHAEYERNPELVRRYALADVEEVAGLARVLGGASFALARMVPRRYERLADAGAATGMIDPLLVRAYLRSGAALPAHIPPSPTVHTGAALHLFAAGVARRIVKADVASLYPSLMRAYRIGPSRDRLGAMLSLVDGLVEQRLSAKAAGRAAPPGSAERFTHEAVSAAMKIVVNSAYGYLAAGTLTRFADVDAANDITRRGRELLGQVCGELETRGVALLEADTDGVYFSVPVDWTEQNERQAVAEVAALLPPLVQLEYEGRYAAMLSHEPKNYALLTYDGTLILKGVAFRSSRAEPYGEAFLRQAVECLLRGDVEGVRRAWLESVDRIRARALSTREVASRVRLTKRPEAYLQVRERRRELPYEALLAAGRSEWKRGDRIRVYRGRGGRAGLLTPEMEEDDPRDYDVDWYVRLLRETYASRFARAFLPDDFDALVQLPDQLPLFAPDFARMRTTLRRFSQPRTVNG